MAGKKNVLITGASRGIGLAIKKCLETSGEYNVITPSRNDMNLEDPASIENYMNQISDIDILINNAGINILKDVEDIDSISLESMLSVNLKSPLALIQKVVPNMKRNNFGRIINISSIWGVTSRESRTLYSMTKFGINGITKSLCRELGKHNIIINSVCPGYVNTELTKQNVPESEQVKIKNNIPLGRFAEPEEIAEFIAFLVSEKNQYITGQTLLIDGGFLA